MAIDLNELANALGQIVLRLCVRRRTSSEWATLNEVLKNGEIGWETDTNRFKFGDGVTSWGDLQYFGDTGAVLTSANAGVGISITQVLPGASDPDWPLVAFMMNWEEGAKDNGPNKLPVVSVGAPDFTTTGAKFGNSGRITNGNGYWKTADDPALHFGANDWTIKGWFYPISYTIGGTTFVANLTFGRFGDFSTPLGTAPLAWVGEDQVCLIDSTGTAHTLNFFDYQIASTTDATHVWDNPAPYSEGQWNYVVMERKGTKIRVWMNGHERACDHDHPGYPTTAPGGFDIGTITLSNSASDFVIGESNVHGGGIGGISFSGLVDDFQVVMGKAQFDAATFTLPTTQLYFSDTPLTTIISATGESEGGSAPLTPDTAPAVASSWDDEFDTGTAVDTAGTRFSGANAWTLHTDGTHAPVVGQGAISIPYGYSGPCVMLQPLPTTDCTFMIKTRRPIKNNVVGWSLGYFNATNGKASSAFAYYTSPHWVVQWGSYNTSTWAFTLNTNVITSDESVDTSQPTYVRFRKVGTTIYYAFSMSGNDGTWYEAGSETISAAVGTGTYYVLLAGGSIPSTCEFFRRVA